MTADARATRVGRLLLAALFGGYLVLLVWAVLWKLHVPYVSSEPSHILKLVPFVASGGAGRSAPSEVFANVAVFVPFGAGLRALRSGSSWVTVGLVGGALSIALEALQFITGVGVADVSDVITNTIGAAIGAAAVGAMLTVAPGRAALGGIRNGTSAVGRR